MRRTALIVAGGLLLAGLVAANWWLLRSPPPAEVPRFSLGGLMGEDAGAEGFARALVPGAIELPRDHGPHPGFRNEWWYFTGNLAGPAGERFGFQLTFFRFALAPASPERRSAWAASDIWMAHFALSDGTAGHHQVVERFARPGPGGAGARGEPFAVWLDDWRAASVGDAFLPLRLTATDEDAGIALDLQLMPGRAPVFNGDRGLSAKGPEPGNASYYYSFTRMPASGRLRAGGREVEVSGQAWLDREWGTSALGAGVAGWDWFALQLDNGMDLMLYGLRHEDGSFTPQSAGTLLYPDGRVLALAAADFSLRPQRWWRSPQSRVRWPLDWELRVPTADLVLQVSPLFDEQEQNLSVRYWEGAIVALDQAGAPAGRGYMELVGYQED